jgi:hypothetical protein
VIAVHDTRCLNHRDREAVARCPSCGDFFCRECVTEHEGRVMCAKCLAGVAGRADGKRSKISFARPILALVSFLFACLFFFLVGRTLLLLPDSFHDGEIWSTYGANAEGGP